MKKVNNLSRRDVLKSLVTIPVLGYFANRFKVNYNTQIKSDKIQIPEIIKDLNAPVKLNQTKVANNADTIRIGIVGNGMRGPQIFRALGFAKDDWVKHQLINDKANTQLKSFLNQQDLNVEITGVCDTFSYRAEQAVVNTITKWRSGNAEIAKKPKVYRNYREMLEDNNIDAIVILTPDHWHAKMASDAAQKGIHVYLEKPMCQTFNEAKNLREVIKNTGIVLQVGHQNRQQMSYLKANEIVRKNVLGEISLIETFTNRNDKHGAWIRGIPENANKMNVDWTEFIGSKTPREFNLDRYFNWQKWFEYGTGPAGNQFTHEYDCINQIMDLGIPDNVVATGGTYFFNDPRDIPDVFNAVFNYPKKGCVLTYDCTLANSKQRDKTIFGREASMAVNVGIELFGDRLSKKYEKYNYNPEIPLYAYNPKFDEIDAVTSATAKYYQERGFGYTYIEGKKTDATYLHIKEWLNCIRNNTQPSCNIDKGFEETATFYMANLSYLENRVVHWNAGKEEIM